MATVVMAAVALVAYFPRGIGPPAATWFLRTFTFLGDSPGNHFRVTWFSPFRLEADGIRLGGMPAAPSCARLSASYSPAGLLSRVLDSVRLDGVSVRPGYLPPAPGAPGGVRDAGRRRAAPAARPGADLLRGFAIRDLRISGVPVDFGHTLPPAAKAALADGRLEAVFTGGAADQGDRVFRGRLSGTFSGGPLAGTVEYRPPCPPRTSCARVRAELSAKPRLAGGARPPPGPLVLRGEAVLRDGTGLEADFKAAAAWSNAVWRAEAEGHSDALGFRCSATLPPTAVTSDDGVVASVLGLVPAISAGRLSGLRFRAELSASAAVTGVAGRLPEWQARGRISDGSASAILGGLAIGVTGLVVRAGCDGVGGRLSPAPAVVSVAAARAGVASFGRGLFRMTAGKEALVMTSGSIGFCGGLIRAYALYLDFDDLRSGFTLFLDRLDVGELVKLLPGVGGSGKGRLYGRLPMRITAKRELRLRDAFLHAMPGETGFVRLADTGPVVETLTRHGVRREHAEAAGLALRDFEYDLLRIDLTRPGGEDGRLSIRLRGRTTSDGKTTPAELDVNLNGPIEKLLNLGLKTATIVK